MPDHLILIRSGATDYELQGRIRGTLDIPLAEAGRAAAQRAAERLAATPPVAVYTSGASCALETSRLVAAACHLRPRRIANLGNLDFGLWQGALVDEIHAKQPRLTRQWQDNPWAVAPPEGELLEEACARVERALEGIRRRHSKGSVALVVPPPLDDVVRWIVSGEPLGDLWSSRPNDDLVEQLPLAAQWRGGPRGQPDAPERLSRHPASA